MFINVKCTDLAKICRWSGSQSVIPTSSVNYHCTLITHKMRIMHLFCYISRSKEAVCPGARQGSSSTAVKNTIKHLKHEKIVICIYQNLTQVHAIANLYWYFTHAYAVIRMYQHITHAQTVIYMYVIRMRIQSDMMINHVRLVH